MFSVVLATSRSISSGTVLFDTGELCTGLGGSEELLEGRSGCASVVDWDGIIDDVSSLSGLLEKVEFTALASGETYLVGAPGTSLELELTSSLNVEASFSLKLKA